MGELRLLAQREAVKCAKGEGEVSLSVVSRLLRIAEDTEMRVRRHVGQPLSIQLTSTAMIAEIFNDM